MALVPSASTVEGGHDHAHVSTTAFIPGEPDPRLPCAGRDRDSVYRTRRGNLRAGHRIDVGANHFDVVGSCGHEHSLPLYAGQRGTKAGDAMAGAPDLTCGHIDRGQGYFLAIESRS